MQLSHKFLYMHACSEQFYYDSVIKSLCTHFDNSNNNTDNLKKKIKTELKLLIVII